MRWTIIHINLSQYLANVKLTNISVAFIIYMYIYSVHNELRHNFAFARTNRNLRAHEVRLRINQTFTVSVLSFFYSDCRWFSYVEN